MKRSENIQKSTEIAAFTWTFYLFQLNICLYTNCGKLFKTTTAIETDKRHDYNN